MKKIYLIAIVVAIIAGFATYFFATQIQKNSSIQDVQKQNVVVALVNIPANTVVTKDMVEVRSLPYMTVGTGTASDISQVVGKVSLYDFAAGEQIMTARVASVGSDQSASGRLSYQLKEGEYPYVLAVDTLSGVAGYLKEGDYVNLYYIHNLEDDEQNVTNSRGTVLNPGDQAVTLLLSNIRILKIAGYAENQAAEAASGDVASYSNITLVLTKAQIIAVQEAVDKGTIKCILVPYSEALGISDELSSIAEESTETATAPKMPANYAAATVTETTTKLAG